jgi:hypothetical protein
VWMTVSSTGIRFKPILSNPTQRASTAVAHVLNAWFGVSMCAYFDWLLWDVPPDLVLPVLQTVQSFGFSVNFQKSVLHPVTCLTYLGLSIDTVRRSLAPTPPCIQHLESLLSIAPLASHQDLFRIAGYLAWFCWAMGWPQFLSSHIRQCSTYWVRVLRNSGFLRKPRSL